VFVSGQIGLIPSSLTIPFPQSLATEIPLVSQHADRVVEALLSNNSGDKHEGHAQITLYWLTQERHVSHAITAAQSLDVSEAVIRLPKFREKQNSFPQPGSTPTLFLVVKDLPKGALIEKQVLYHTGRGFAADDEDGDSERVSHLPLYGSGNYSPRLSSSLSDPGVRRRVCRSRNGYSIRSGVSPGRRSLRYGDLREGLFGLERSSSSPRDRSTR
jgi:diphthine-ammonia ligase